MKRVPFLFAIVVIILPIAVYFLHREAIITIPGLPTPPATQLYSNEIPRIEEAVRKAINQERETALVLLMYETQIDHFQISQDGNWATAWLNPLDPETNEVVPTEPGLALVEKKEGEWSATLPTEAEWLIKIYEIPEDVLPPEDKQTWLEMASIALQTVTGTYRGYYLPWRGGETMALTQSVGHDRYTPSGNAHYAFDFAKPGSPSVMFDVVAAKSGTVKQAVWKHPNGNESYGNYIVLEDTTTSPTTYQLYLHLAQNSIPEELRVVGAPVRQGQFLGVADDTGISSGNHLHFMVHTNSVSYWGRSVDITFEDVSINGGRPRIRSDLNYCREDDVCETTQTLYLSKNFLSPDHVPPTGDILVPVHNATIGYNPLFLFGWALDDNSGLASAKFIANYGGSWHPVGEAFLISPFGMDWDICADQVPDGPVSLALEIRDKAFNYASGLPGLRHFTKNYECPITPTCVPTSNQIALFAEPDYRGACVVLNTGRFTSASSLGNLGEDNAASIQVGANVQATLYMDSNLIGRGETFTASDSNLSDNRIGTNTTSSVLVQLRNVTPGIPILVFPEASASYKDHASFTLAWDNAGSSTQYQARIKLGSTQTITSSWQTDPFWHFSSLTAGSYTWQVRARNSYQTSSWSSTRALTIQAATPSSSPTYTAPYTDTFEAPATDWLVVKNWDRTNEINHTPGGAQSWQYDVGAAKGYDNGAPNAGYLTSPPIRIPTGDTYYLRFWYFYETEGPEVHWDQRWVQISVNGGPYSNLLQLSYDAPNYWLRSPSIPLASYAGKTIQIRFYFATLDKVFNNYKGWLIDDFSINNTPPTRCADNDNDITRATSIQYGENATGTICPAGDVDYYKFQAISGDQVGVRVEAQSSGSKLDSYLYLLDTDGRSVLAENDDQVLAQRTDSFLSYKFLRTGTYYLKIRAWDHPSSGSEQHFYTLRMVKDNEDPTAAFIYPVDGGGIPSSKFNLMVNATDAKSGVSYVQFLWHSADWQGSNWIVLGEDWDPTDGWNYPFNGAKVTNPNGIAFYARVFDWAGNWIGIGAWNLTRPMLFFPFIRKGK